MEVTELRRLYSELDKQRELNTKLWAAVAYLQQSVGVACGWCSAGELTDDRDDFYEPTRKSDDILDGIVALVSLT